MFAFVWVTHYSMLAYALAGAARESTILHADARRLLIETMSPSGEKSVEVSTASIRSIVVAPAAADPLRPSVPVPSIQVTLHDGTSHLLLGGHHLAELEWVAATLAEVTGCGARWTSPGYRTRRARSINRTIFRADLPFAGGVGR